jgi:hypothetical protein
VEDLKKDKDQPLNPFFQIKDNQINFNEKVARKGDFMIKNGFKWIIELVETKISKENYLM